MTTSKEQELFSCHPKLWTDTAVKWELENLTRYEILLRSRVKSPAQEQEITSELETVEAPDLEQAVAAAHALLDKHAHEAGDLGVEIYLLPPEQPYADQERLGVRHYKLSANARKQARAIGIRGGDLEVRIARMVRHAGPFGGKTANLTFQGILLRVEDDTVTWIGPAIPPRRRRRKASGRKAK